MIQVTEIGTDNLVHTLRIYVNDLVDKRSPFNKNEEYLRDLAGWIACTATRIENLSRATDEEKK